MNHKALTLMILQLTAMLDTAKHDKVTAEDAFDHIGQRDVLAWLKHLAPDHFAYDLFAESTTPYCGFEQFWCDRLVALSEDQGSARRKWGVQRRGLCVLIAWTNEIIQQGIGWRPA
jgi:hypothetical protein